MIRRIRAVVLLLTLLPAVGCKITYDLSPSGVAAETLMVSLRDGNVDQAFSKLPPGGVNAETVVREKKYPLRWWSFKSKKCSASTCRIEYSVVRGFVPITEPAWVTVQESKGEWQATEFSAVY